MKRKLFFIVFITVLITSCEKENDDILDPSEFLLEESVNVIDLIGEWTWINTHGGYTGQSRITPETEGYFKTIVFTSQQNYLEILDNKLTIQSYYSIDSTDLDHYGTPIFNIRYLESSIESQDMLIQQSNDTLYLYLYENNDCRDCLGTSVYRRIK
jgi:hypothetical protein